ncbi:MAG: hypothetical protein HUU38_13400 [Anaerolineales bacterium]|nr:hypothetical protein [Anaerolineales bacterium]
MLKRLATSGLNFAVLGISILVFLVSFFALNSLAAAQRPPTLTVLAAARDLPIGHPLTAADLVEKTVYADDNAALYIPAEEVPDLIGGITALPMYAGQPIFRSSVLAPAGEGFRLSAFLAEYPDHSLFPLPLSENNITAPDAASFLPGDLIGITVVIAGRPQPPATPTPSSGSWLPTPVLTRTLSLTPGPEADLTEALDRTFPPLAKDLFPQGVRVIAIEGLPQPVSSNDPNAPVFVSAPQDQRLILLIPNASREPLSLALQQGAQLFISLLARGDEGVTPGFTYWDFEDLFRADREEALQQP